MMCSEIMFFEYVCEIGFVGLYFIMYFCVSGDGKWWWVVCEMVVILLGCFVVFVNCWFYSCELFVGGSWLLMLEVELLDKIMVVCLFVIIFIDVVVVEWVKMIYLCDF